MHADEENPHFIDTKMYIFHVEDNVRWGYGGLPSEHFSIATSFRTLETPF